jgi:hypothetical protein
MELTVKLDNLESTIEKPFFKDKHSTISTRNSPEELGSTPESLDTSNLLTLREIKPETSLSIK